MVGILIPSWGKRHVGLPLWAEDQENLVLMLSVGLTIATLRSDNGDIHENVAER